MYDFIGTYHNLPRGTILIKDAGVEDRKQEVQGSRSWYAKKELQRQRLDGGMVKSVSQVNAKVH